MGTQEYLFFYHSLVTVSRSSVSHTDTMASVSSMSYQHKTHHVTALIYILVKWNTKHVYKYLIVCLYTSQVCV